MKILILANARAVHTQRWAIALAERGHDVCVISIRCADMSGVTVLRRSIGDVDNSKLAAFFSYLLLLMRLPFDLRRIKPDVVNPHYCITHGVIAAIAGARPRVVNVWGSDLIWDGKDAMPSWRRRLIKFSLQHADRIISTSRFMEDAVRKIVAVPPPIDLVPFGVDTSRFKPEQTPAKRHSIRIGFIKTFSKKYAPEIFVEAAAIAIRENPALEFVMAGRGPLLSEIENLAARSGLGEKISFAGFTPHNQVADLMRSLDVLVNCSRYESESFGVVICEASACGLPVIVTDVGGVRETLLDGETGILIPKEDPQSLASAMLKLAANAGLRKRMGENGRAFICSTYEWKHCVDLMENALRASMRDND